LNRDDTNSPKECEFGGYRRARISSQCLKRAIRTSFSESDLLPAVSLAMRTKRLSDELVQRLTGAGRPEEASRLIVERALGGLGLKVNPDGKTQYLLFLGEAEVAGLAGACLQYWDDLTAGPGTESAGTQTARQAKSKGKENVPDEVKKALHRVMDGGRAADLALFGRMLADRPDLNIDAAAQVAHAISTNKVAMEFDFYTAVDDLRPEDTQSADMLGTVEFNSACFYRYLNVDVDELTKNLQGDTELVRQALRAFLRAAVSAIPSGKQNSFAAYNPPSLVCGVVTASGAQNLSNAFVKPVQSDRNGDLIENSVHELSGYRGRILGMYGSSGAVGARVSTTVPDAIDHLGERVPVETLITDLVTMALDAPGAQTV
jgi:CRISPR system Cascade subunit CasC